MFKKTIAAMAIGLSITGAMAQEINFGFIFADVHHGALGNSSALHIKGSRSSKRGEVRENTK